MAKRSHYGPGVLLILGHLAGIASAEVLSSQEGRFSIEVPKLPEPHYRWVDNKTNRAWTIGYREQPAQRTVSPAFLEKHYDLVVQGVLDGTKAKLVHQRPVLRGDMTGRELVIQGGSTDKPMMTRQQFFLTANRFYMLTFSGPPGTEASNDVEAFFASFKVLP